RARIDVAAVHRFLAGESYWAAGRAYDVQERLVREAVRGVGLYPDGAPVGFCRGFGDGVVAMYPADAYGLREPRGGGLGVALVREMIDGGPYAALTWLLHTADAHELYAKLGFATPGPKALERPRPGL